MLELVRLALRINTNAFDSEISMLISDCLHELVGLGIISTASASTDDAQINSCVIFYCKWHFGQNSDCEKWERIYHDKVTKLMYMDGYGLEAAYG